LILLNKIDIIEENKGKDILNHVYRDLDYTLLQKKYFLVKEISALKCINLEESIRWLFNTLTVDNNQNWHRLNN